MEAKAKTAENKEVFIIATCYKEEALPTDSRTFDWGPYKSCTTVPNHG